jgi:methylthioribose-1-phosphate isomerase
MSIFKTIEWQDGVVRMLDQRLLPYETRYLEFHQYEEVSDAIREMVIRGALSPGSNS